MTCKLLNGWLTYVLQVLLGAIALSSIYYKWKNEYPKRQFKVVCYDVVKQIVGMGIAHLLNIIIAVYISHHYTVNDECRWYFLNFIVDVVFGVWINYLLLRLVNHYINKHAWTKLQTGNYYIGNNCCNSSFIYQLLIWVSIILICKVIILCLILLPAHNILNSFGKWILGPVSKHPNAELAVVMVIFPVLLNIIQFWIQDNFLKGSRHYMSPIINTADVDDGNLSKKYSIHRASDYVEL